MDADLLTLLRDEIARTMAYVKKCDATYKGFRAFKGNHRGLEFCATQLLQAAANLREHAKQLAVIAEDLHTTYSFQAQSEDMPGNDSDFDEERRRDGAIA